MTWLYPIVPYLRAVESGLHFGELFGLAQMREHFAPLFKVQDEVEIRIVFEVEPELDQKREIDRVEDPLFGQRVVHLGWGRQIGK